MVPKHVMLGIPDWVGAGLAKGDFVREGGVIRQAGNGKLVAFLPEIDARRLGMEELIASHAVPLVVQGVSTFVLERRLQRIEAKLALALSEVREIRAEQEYHSVLAEAAALGRAAGTLRAMLLDPAAAYAVARYAAKRTAEKAFAEASNRVAGRVAAEAGV